MALFEPGAQVGGARISRVLGSGTVATVYEAIHEGARRALKIIDGTFESSTARERFAQEGEAIAMVEHVNVVRWFGCGIDNGRPWILLELVDGPNLRELVRATDDGRLSPERAVTIMRHVCEGLAAVHKKGIVHRDLKPENILVADYDLAKVADFGSAKLPGWGVKTTTAHRLTSMAYTPPETWRGLNPTDKGDVYAAGIVLYELISGANPIVPKVTDVLTMCAAHLNHEPPPLASVANVSDNLSELVRRAMSKAPAQRPTMRAFADALEVEQDRLLAWRRAAARSLPLPNREPGLALTVPMAATSDPEGTPSSSQAGGPGSVPAASVPTSAPPARRGLHGTVLMEGTPAPTPDRSATPPPAPPPSMATASPPAPPSSMPSTLRTPSRPLPAADAASAPDAVRRTTGIPVESAARPSSASPRRPAVGVAIAASVLAVLAAATWWTLAGRDSRPEPKLAAPPPTAPASVVAPSAASPASASATPARSPRRLPTPAPAPAHR
jgi:serine/threonine-protein kinase